MDAKRFIFVIAITTSGCNLIAATNSTIATTPEPTTPEPTTPEPITTTTTTTETES